MSGGRIEFADQRQAIVTMDILDERDRQDRRWGEQNHPNGTGNQSQLRRARVARVVCDKAAQEGRLAWALILEEEVSEALAESDTVKLREELVQVAAVCIAWMEAIDRRSAEQAGN